MVETTFTSESLIDENILRTSLPIPLKGLTPKTDLTNIKRLWASISSPQVQSLWVNDVFSAKYWTPTDPFDYTDEKSNNGALLTGCFNVDSFLCCSDNDDMVINKEEEEHLLGNLLQNTNDSHEKAHENLIVSPDFFISVGLSPYMTGDNKLSSIQDHSCISLQRIRSTSFLTQSHLYHRVLFYPPVEAFTPLIFLNICRETNPVFSYWTHQTVPHVQYFEFSNVYPSLSQFASYYDYVYFPAPVSLIPYYILSHEVLNRNNLNFIQGYQNASQTVSNPLQSHYANHITQLLIAMTSEKDQDRRMVQKNTSSDCEEPNIEKAGNINNLEDSQAFVIKDCSSINLNKNLKTDRFSNTERPTHRHIDTTLFNRSNHILTLIHTDRASTGLKMNHFLISRYVSIINVQQKIQFTKKTVRSKKTSKYHQTVTQTSHFKYIRKHKKTVKNKFSLDPSDAIENHEESQCQSMSHQTYKLLFENTILLATCDYYSLENDLDLKNSSCGYEEYEVENSFSL